MFIEPLLNTKSSHGWIEVISGPMFSGKTEELLRRLKRAKIANFSVAIFKPSVDARYSKEEVVSHDANAIKSIVIKRPVEIIDQHHDKDVIAVDEAQFFNDQLVDILQYLALKGKRVIVAGLDMDSDGKPFGPMPQLLAVAEFITKLHSICMECGSLATHSYRMIEKKGQVLVGAADTYKPLCRKCYYKLTSDKGLPQDNESK